jgi:hypothetical protein
MDASLPVTTLKEVLELHNDTTIIKAMVNGRCMFYDTFLSYTAKMPIEQKMVCIYYESSKTLFIHTL